MGFGALLIFYEDAANYAALDYHLPPRDTAVWFPSHADRLGAVERDVPDAPLIILLFPDGTLIIAILLGGGAWQMRGTRIVVQLKWLMAGSAASVIGLAGGFAFQSGILNTVCLAVGIFSLPVCISFAILKYRLYDIDRLISRTLSYALVTGLLVGVYAGLVLLATEVFRFHSAVAVAASTLAVAALFNPLRRRMQHVIDRRFNRARYDADRTIAAFAARLKDEVDLNSIRDDLAVHQALEPARVSVWISRRS